MPNTNIIIEDLEKAAKREHLADDSNVVKKQKLNLEKLENDLDADADNLLSLTTKCDDLYKMKKFLTEADSLKKSSKEKKKLAGDYEATIENMENELSSFKKK